MDQESRWYSMFKRLDQNKNHPTQLCYGQPHVHCPGQSPTSTQLLSPNLSLVTAKFMAAGRVANIRQNNPTEIKQL